MLDENPDTVRPRDGSRVLLALFGKHPAWDDHMEDIGIDSPSLAAFKKWLYVDGIRSNLDTGAWEQLAEDRRVAAWDHRLLMTGPTGMILAHLWASSDGRGRRAFPMVAATHLPTSCLPMDLGPMFEALDTVKDVCCLAQTRDGVAAAASYGSEALERAARRLSPLPPEGPSAHDRAEFIDAPEMGPGRIGFERLFHVIHGDLAPFLAGSKTRREGPVRPRTFRVPVPPESAERSLLLWHAFFHTQIRPDTLWTAAHARGADWADITIGMPEQDCVFGYRANPLELPLPSQVAYNVPDEIRSRTARIVEAFVSSPGRVPKINEDESKEGGGIGGIVGRLFRGGS